MGDNKTKTKTAMLSELESIKGLLLEEDDIPILQEEVIEQHVSADNDIDVLTTENKTKRTIFEQQQDFFNSVSTVRHDAADAAEDLLDTLDTLEQHTADVTAHKSFSETPKTNSARPVVAKASGENPFLPEHIRARLHGNNPPPLFAQETAKKIANTNRPTTLLGSLPPRTGLHHVNATQQNLIDSIVEKLMPEIELELRERLESMSKTMLNELNK